MGGSIAYIMIIACQRLQVLRNHQTMMLTGRIAMALQGPLNSGFIFQVKQVTKPFFSLRNFLAPIVGIIYMHS